MVRIIKRGLFSIVILFVFSGVCPIAVAGGFEDCSALVQHLFVGNPDMPILFVIEENHADLAVQWQVACAVEMVVIILEREPPLLLIEGSNPRQLSLLSEQVLRTEPQWRMAAAEAWFELGWLSGAELAAIRLPNLLVWGVEEAFGPERLRHWEALQDEKSAWARIIPLWEQLRYLDFDVFLATLEVIGRIKILEKPLIEGLPLKEMAESLSEQLAAGEPLRDVLSKLKFTPPSDSYAKRNDELKMARQKLFKAVVSAALANNKLDQNEAEELLRLHEVAHMAAKIRHQALINNISKILREGKTRVGILVIGAGHTSELIEELGQQGFSYVVITPTAITGTTPAREADRFVQILERQHRGDKHLDPMTRWLASEMFKPSLILTNPASLESFSASCGLLQMADRALRGEKVSEWPKGAVIEAIEVVRTPQLIRISVVGKSGRSFVWELPHNFILTESAARELIKHTLQALEADNLLEKREDGFFTPSVHVYLEPDGMHGGAFLSYKLNRSTFIVKAVPLNLPRSAEELLQEYRKTIRDYEEAVREGLPQSECRARFLAVLQVLDVLQPVVILLNQLLEDLKIPKDQIVPVVLSMARISSEGAFREINFTQLATIARLVQKPHFDRTLMFVKCGLEPDVQIGSPERWLLSTLSNVHAWAPTQKHIAVFVVPTEGTEEEWNNNPFAQYLAEMGVTLEAYREHILPAVQEAIQAIGSDNVIQPSNLEEFLTQLEESLKNIENATVTLTFVGHRVADKEGLYIHFKTSGSEEPLDVVISKIQQLQEQGKIPGTINLEFNLIICSAEKEAVPGLLMGLPARLVLSSAHEVGLVTSMKLLAEEAEGLRKGTPLYEAYLNAMESFVRAILEGKALPSFTQPEPSARNDGEKCETGVV